MKMVLNVFWRSFLKSDQITLMMFRYSQRLNWLHFRKNTQSHDKIVNLEQNWINVIIAQECHKRTLAETMRYPFSLNSPQQ